MDELLHELADAELGKHVMDTVGVAVTKGKTLIGDSYTLCGLKRDTDANRNFFNVQRGTKNS